MGQRDIFNDLKLQLRGTHWGISRVEPQETLSSLFWGMDVASSCWETRSDHGVVKRIPIEAAMPWRLESGSNVHAYGVYSLIITNTCITSPSRALGGSFPAG